RRKVDEMMDTFVGAGPMPRTVYWLRAPAPRTPRKKPRAPAGDALGSAGAPERGATRTFLDHNHNISTASAEESRRQCRENGKTIEARISDGVHFTADGAAYLARGVFALLDARWKLTKQADPAQPYHWSLAYGSGESVPGYHYHHSNYSGSQQSSETTSSPST